MESAKPRLCSYMASYISCAVTTVRQAMDVSQVPITEMQSKREMAKAEEIVFRSLDFLYPTAAAKTARSIFAAAEKRELPTRRLMMSDSS